MDGPARASREILNDRRFEAERKLLVALLVGAVEAYTRRRKTREGIEAAGWLFSDDRSRFLCFLNVCDVLAIDSERLRRRVLRLGNRPLRRPFVRRGRPSGLWRPRLTQRSPRARLVTPARS